jgi:hypothetical protein
VSSSILLADEARLARRNVRHNAVALGADFALFLVGLAFASQSTILPAFAAHLGAPNVVIGAIPAVMTLGWFLPSLFAAGHTESLARKLPFVMRFTLWERVPFLALALIAFFVATPAPAVALTALLLLLLIVTGTGGVLMPAWMDIVGRAIRPRCAVGSSEWPMSWAAPGAWSAAWAPPTFSPGCRRRRATACAFSAPHSAWGCRTWRWPWSASRPPPRPCRGSRWAPICVASPPCSRATAT